MRTHAGLFAAAAALTLILGAVFLALPATGQTSGPVLYGCVAKSATGAEYREIYNVHQDWVPTCNTGDFGIAWQGMPFPSPSPTASPTASPTTSPTTSPSNSPTSSPSSSPSATPSPSPISVSPSPDPTPTGRACTAQTGGTCGPYDWSGWPGANGYNTYVIDQEVGPVSPSETLTASGPGHWGVTASDGPARYTGVQMFDAVQQLTNNWSSDGTFSGTSDTPLSALSSLSVSYAETSPSDAGSVYEFAADVWDDNYGADVMFWADTSPTRCTNNGMSSGNIIGHATLGGQAWTVYRYGGAGSEIIFILDGGSSTDPVDSGTCAQQSSGAIDVFAGFKWLVANGYMSGLGALSQLNTGWEICSADKTTFTVSSMAYNVTLAGAAAAARLSR